VVTAVELSPHLAAVARAKLPDAEVVGADFDTWDLPEEKFDLVISATAFHWLDPATRVGKCADALRPGGMLAVVSTDHIAGGTQQFFVDAMDCYRRFTDDAADKPPRPADAIPQDSAEIDSSGRFGPVEFRRYEWEATYSTSEYLEVLSSYSGHRALTEARRDGLYRCISALMDRFSGSVTKRYLFQLSAAICLHNPLHES
jgi:SAM-dependent methyltransferase